MFFKFFKSVSPNPNLGKHKGDNALAKLGDLNVLLPLQGTASPIGVVVPQFIGQQYVNTTTGKVYSAVGKTSSNWNILN